MASAQSGAPAHNTRSLKATFAAAERRREAIERGVFHPASAAARLPTDSVGTPASYGDAVRAALTDYDECARRVAALALFSTNEAADDIATAHLPYLLVPYRVAELTLKLPTARPGPTERRAVLQQARDAYERFLHHLDGYELLPPTYVRLLRAYTEDPTQFSTVGASSSAAKSSATGSGIAGLADPTARRNAKIANFRAEKELQGKLDVLRKRQQERRELQRRRRQRLRASVAEDESGAATAGEDNDEEDDENGDEDGDDEEARRLYLAQLAYAVHMAFQSLEGINVEDDILAKAPVALMTLPNGASGGLGTAGGLQDGRQRPGGSGGGESDISDRLDHTHNLANTLVLRRLQSALAGTPTWAGAMNPNGPLLTTDGKPRQPFTILGNRAEMARNVFRPGHNLPTMSIDEYLDEERRRGGIIDGGGPSSGIAPEPDEDNYDKADAETMKARAWDEFTEANPRGSGNTLNKG